MWYITFWYYGSSVLWKSCAFGKIVKRYSINSTPQIELSCTKATCRSHKVRSRARVTCRGHVEGSRAGRMRVAHGDLHLQIGEVITVQTLRVKRRCQLVVRLKANKSYQELLRSLSSYINFLNIRLCLGLYSLRKCYWRYNRYHLQGCRDCIAGHIALIALTISVIVSLWSLWPNRSGSIVDCIGLIFVLESVLCIWYHFH